MCYEQTKLRLMHLRLSPGWAQSALHVFCLFVIYNKIQNVTYFKDEERISVESLKFRSMAKIDNSLSGHSLVSLSL